MTLKEVKETMHKELETNGVNTAKASLEHYFDGVDKTLQPGSPIYNLGLVERRKIPDRATDNITTLGIRKNIASPSDIIIAYAALLFRSVYFANQVTIETRKLLEKGLAKSLGITNSNLRHSLTRIHQDRELSNFLKYSQVANIDSVQFPNASIGRIRKHGYSCGEVVWA